MSVHEPPGGRQPDGPHGYAQPQDPWGGDGFDTGVASVPTEPVPQPYGYQQPYGRAGVWSQETMQHGSSMPWMPPPRRSRVGVVILTLLAVLLVGGGGGYGAYYIATHRTVSGGPTTGPTTGGPTSTERQWAIDKVVIGDCIAVDNARTDRPTPHFTGCAKGAYQVLAVKKGDGVQQDGDGVLDEKEAQNTCATTTYTNYYAYDDTGTANDYVLCLAVLR
jgi:hypothetical protein